MQLRQLPSKNVLLILILGGGIVAFVLLSIFPNYSAYSNITHEIETLEQQIEEQKILSPIFEDLRQKALFEKPGTLPFPEQTTLPRGETGRLSAIIQTIVQQNDCTLERIVTDMDSLAAGSGILKMSVYMRGDFLNLRPVLIRLGELPYLRHVETIRVEQQNGHNEIMLDLWIAQESL